MIRLACATIRRYRSGTPTVLHPGRDVLCVVVGSVSSSKKHGTLVGHQFEYLVVTVCHRVVQTRWVVVGVVRWPCESDTPAFYKRRRVSMLFVGYPLGVVRKHYGDAVRYTGACHITDPFPFCTASKM